MENKRIEWVDIAKGIGIILVVLGHCLNIDTPVFHIIFMFHMPLFFILGGYVFNNKKRFQVFMCKKIQTLVIPFFCFYLMGLVVTLIIPEWRDGLSKEGIIKDLWLADPNAIHNSSIWFLICLFWVQMLFWIISKMRWITQITVIAFLYIVGMVYSYYRPVFMGYNRLPLNLDVVPIACMFFAIGYFMKEQQLVSKLFSSRTVQIIVGLFSVIGIWMIYKWNGYVNLHGLRFGNPVAYFAGGIVGSLFVIDLSGLIEKMDLFKIKEILLFYGKNSLIILGFQSLLIRLYIVVLQRLGIELSLYRFPLKHAVLCFVLVAFIECPLMCVLWKCLHKYLNAGIRKK